LRKMLARLSVNDRFHDGFIPERVLSWRAALRFYAHVDCFLTCIRVVIDCVEFASACWSLAAYMIFDDYGFPKLWRGR